MPLLQNCYRKQYPTGILRQREPHHSADHRPQSHTGLPRRTEAPKLRANTPHDFPESYFGPTARDLQCPRPL
ncbi:hypothetical protein BD779DRAFT_1497965 [Infundibulicybe gibba]|nr:hypothetical protein BD779DRAFT_1497965 [Infundibulicybe gibba]